MIKDDSNYSTKSPLWRLKPWLNILSIKYFTNDIIEPKILSLLFFVKREDGCQTAPFHDICIVPPSANPP